jgi:hypothetical protein
MVLLTLFAIGYGVTQMARTSESWTEVVPVTSGSVEIEYHYSKRPYFEILPHGNGFGGGDEKFDLRIKAGGKTYRWHGPAIPVVLRERGDQLFLVGFDRETSSKGCTFRLYRSKADRTFAEIDRAEFPKDLAIQNLWLDSHDEQVLNPMDASSYWFRESITARLWQYLEFDIQYWVDQRPLPAFLTQYRDTHLKSVIFGTTTMPGTIVRGSSPTYRRAH